MSRVLLLRHSKAASAVPGMRDFDRPLEERGVEHAAAAGKAIAAAGLNPDLVLCSPARRTRQTWEGVGKAVGPAPAGIRFLEALYGSDTSGYVAAIRAAGPAETVLVIGHNPMIAETALLLAGSGDPDAISNLRSRFPTSSVAVIAFATPLAEVAPGAGRLEAYMMRGG